MGDVAVVGPLQRAAALLTPEAAETSIDAQTNPVAADTPRRTAGLTRAALVVGTATDAAPLGHVGILPLLLGDLTADEIFARIALRAGSAAHTQSLFAIARQLSIAGALRPALGAPVEACGHANVVTAQLIGIAVVIALAAASIIDAALTVLAGRRTSTATLHALAFGARRAALFPRARRATLTAVLVGIQAGAFCAAARLRLAASAPASAAVEGVDIELETLVHGAVAVVVDSIALLGGRHHRAETRLPEAIETRLLALATAAHADGA